MKKDSLKHIINCSMCNTNLGSFVGFQIHLLVLFCEAQQIFHPDDANKLDVLTMARG